MYLWQENEMPVIQEVEFSDGRSHNHNAVTATKSAHGSNGSDTRPDNAIALSIEISVDIIGQQIQVDRLGGGVLYPNGKSHRPAGFHNDNGRGRLGHHDRRLDVVHGHICRTGGCLGVRCARGRQVVVIESGGHRIAHGRNTERNRLIWLYDIHLLVESMDEAELTRFHEKALQRSIGVLCADALEVINGLFNTKLPPELIEELKGNKKNEPSARLIHSIKLRWAWADMQSLKGIKEKAAFAKELLFG